MARTAVIRGGGAVSILMVVLAVGNVLGEVIPHPLAEHGEVGVAETVYRLLCITDEHVEVTVGEALLEQIKEVLILLGTRVLELIDHEVGNHRVDALIDKVGATLEHRADEFVGVTNEN